MNFIHNVNEYLKKLAHSSKISSATTIRDYADGCFVYYSMGHNDYMYLVAYMHFCPLHAR